MGRAGIYRFFGHAPVIATAWKLVRWPLLLAILLAVIAALYRYGPNVRHAWRQCLPGAALAVLLWMGAAALFRATQGSDGADGPGLDEDDEGFPHCPRTAYSVVGDAKGNRKASLRSYGEQGVVTGSRL